MTHRPDVQLRSRRWWAGMLLVAAGVLPGCAMTNEGSRAELDRPFGRRFVHFFEMIASVPEAISEDYAFRSRHLAMSFDAFGEQTRREVAKTAAHPVPDVVGDTRLHWPILMASFQDLGADTAEDVRYAVPRLWQELKMLE